MRYIYTIDEAIKSHLTAQGYRLLSQQNTVSGQAVWIFENSESKPFCFDKNDKAKVFVSDKFALRFG